MGWAVVAYSLAAAAAFAASGSLKHLSAGQTADPRRLRPAQLARFARATAAHPLWLAGIGCDAAGLALQVLALHRGRLAVVQPLLVTSLVFTLVARAGLERRRITGAQLGCALVVTAALAGFLLLTTAPTTQGRLHADPLPAVIAGAFGVLITGTCIELGRRRGATIRRAALLGVAVGIIYAATAALLKSLTGLPGMPLHLLTAWQLYALLALGGLGLLLNQIAFHAGPITASLPAIATLDPLVSITVGVTVYDEPLRAGPGHGLLLAALLALLATAVIQLARSPAAAPRPATAGCREPAAPQPGTGVGAFGGEGGPDRPLSRTR